VRVSEKAGALGLGLTEAQGTDEGEGLAMLEGGALQ
jgi:hypothetical protein